MVQREYVFKVVILGDGGVGKTSLVLQYTENQFTGNYIMTIGSNFAVKILHRPEENMKIKLQLWDLAGQLHFKFIRPPFYQGALLSVLVFDLTSRESFENIGLWQSETLKNVGEIPFLLIGNKKDLQSERVVSKSEGEELAKEIGALGYFETSAKTGENLDEMMDQCVDIIIERM